MAWKSGIPDKLHHLTSKRHTPGPAQRVLSACTFRSPLWEVSPLQPAGDPSPPGRPSSAYLKTTMWLEADGNLSRASNVLSHFLSYELYELLHFKGGLLWLGSTIHGLGPTIKMNNVLSLYSDLVWSGWCIF